MTSYVTWLPSAVAVDTGVRRAVSVTSSMVVRGCCFLEEVPKRMLESERALSFADSAFVGVVCGVGVRDFVFSLRFVSGLDCIEKKRVDHVTGVG